MILIEKGEEEEEDKEEKKEGPSILEEQLKQKWRSYEEHIVLHYGTERNLQEF